MLKKLYSAIFHLEAFGQSAECTIRASKMFSKFRFVRLLYSTCFGFQLQINDSQKSETVEFPSLSREMKKHLHLLFSASLERGN